MVRRGFSGSSPEEGFTKGQHMAFFGLVSNHVRHLAPIAPPVLSPKIRPHYFRNLLQLLA